MFFSSSLSLTPSSSLSLTCFLFPVAEWFFRCCPISLSLEFFSGNHVCLNSYSRNVISLQWMLNLMCSCAHICSSSSSRLMKHAHEMFFFFQITPSGIWLITSKWHFSNFLFAIFVYFTYVSRSFTLVVDWLVGSIARLIALFFNLNERMNSCELNFR